MTGRNPAKDKVAIAGVGLSPYARDRGVTTELALLLEAAVAAITDAGLTAADIDGVVGGGLLTGGIDPATVVSALGLPAVTWWARVVPPIMNHLVAAINAVWTGACEVALVYHSVYRVGGFSRSAAADPFRRRAAFGLPDGRAATGDGHGDAEPWSMHGSAGYAAWAGRYLAEFGTSREGFGLLAINGRSNAAANPNAVLREPLTMAGYLGGRMIREPLCLYDMDIPVDGADAFIVTTAERARDMRASPVLIHAATMGMTAPPEEHLAAGLDATGQPLAARDLRAKSDLWLDDIDLFFPYDGFTIVALRCFESYGFCGPGEAGAFLADNWDVAENRIKIKGRLPVNTHGGSLSEGGSQGAGHLREAVTQLRGQAGRRQVPGAQVALLTPGGFFFNAQGLVLRAGLLGGIMGMLDGKVAIVTGGGRGLGRAHCLALATHGAAVVVNDPGAGLHGESTDQTPAEAVVAEITAAGGRAVADHSSVTDWAASHKLIALAASEFGRLDVVVNNAGILRDRMLFSMTEDEFDAVIAVHLKGTFAMTRHACAYWREEAKRGAGRGGRIINTTSGTGLFGTVGQANYGAAKAGIVSLTTITALEMARYQVTANAISPIARTRMTDGIAGVPVRNPVPDGPVPDGFDPQDPANASGLVVYLASDASSWLTGQVFRVHGNRVQRLRGWRSAGEYRSKSGGAVEPGELITGLPETYGTAPAGRLPDPALHGA
jgi:NAD(P)-dependent dehydrogenase (short-subunit alcohol dehydrogenase family)/acetyl-CoA acetyltransferase